MPRNLACVHPLVPVVRIADLGCVPSTASRSRLSSSPLVRPTRPLALAHALTQARPSAALPACTYVPRFLWLLFPSTTHILMHMDTLRSLIPPTTPLRGSLAPCSRSSASHPARRVLKRTSFGCLSAWELAQQRRIAPSQLERVARGLPAALGPRTREPSGRRDELRRLKLWRSLTSLPPTTHRCEYPQPE
mgnify:CR=1 FL=1